jgi:hypothetical protein
VKLVWFSHFVPYPPKGGNLQRSYNLIRQASRSYQITLVALNLLGESPKRLRSHTGELKKYCDRVEIWNLPYRWRGLRWQLEALTSPFFQDPFSCRALYSKALCSRWEQLLREHPGALLHFDSIDLALYASPAKGFRKVLNHHNCESAMAMRRAHQESNPLKKAFLSLQARKLAREEKSICAEFDSNLVVSEQDGALLRANQPSTHTHVVENGVDTGYFQPSPVQGESRTSRTQTARRAWFSESGNSLGWHSPRASRSEFPHASFRRRHATHLREIHFGKERSRSRARVSFVSASFGRQRRVKPKARRVAPIVILSIEVKLERLAYLCRASVAKRS